MREEARDVAVVVVNRGKRYWRGGGGRVPERRWVMYDGYKKSVGGQTEARLRGVAGN